MNDLDRIVAEITLKNNAPRADFENLSSNDMHSLLRETYSESSILKFQNIISNDVLDKISLFRIAEDLLKIIEKEKLFKLTPTGALPIKTVKELYEKQYLFDEMIESGISKLYKEESCIAIRSVRIAIVISGLVKKTHGKLSLTKNGEKYLKPENRQKLFEYFFQIFAHKFNWSFNDGYQSTAIGQETYSYSIFLLAKFGQNFELSGFYSNKQLKAFPFLLEECEESLYCSKERIFQNCYSMRTFNRFLDWFALTEFESSQSSFYNDNIKVKQADIFSKIFQIEI